MAEEKSDERTEPATPRRREEARERGHVARSPDLSSAAILLAGVLALRFFGRDLVGSLRAASARIFETLSVFDGERESLLMAFGGALAGVLIGFLPFLGAVLAAALAANLFQVGFLFTTESLAPDLSKLDPVAGLGRLFSLRGVARLVSGLLKLTAVGVVVWLTLEGEQRRLVELSGFEVEVMTGFGVDLMLSVALRAALVLLVVAILDYGYQKWQYERDLRMSKQEVREELKRYEGDPRIRERRRAIQRQLALQRMMEKVPKATVVITNPTHFAVAVEYRKESMEAPVVVAKGAEHLAQRIRETAMEHGVPVIERKELAQALYKAVDVGQSIPPALYQAMAEVLAFVFRLKGSVRAA